MLPITLIAYFCNSLEHIINNMYVLLPRQFLDNSILIVCLALCALCTSLCSLRIVCSKTLSNNLVFICCSDLTVMKAVVLVHYSLLYHSLSASEITKNVGYVGSTLVRNCLYNPTQDVLADSCTEVIVKIDLVCYICMCMRFVCLAAHQGRVTVVLFVLEMEWLLSTGQDKNFTWHCSESGQQLGTYRTAAWVSGLQYPPLLPCLFS